MEQSKFAPGDPIKFKGGYAGVVHEVMPMEGIPGEVRHYVIDLMVDHRTERHVAAESNLDPP